MTSSQRAFGNIAEKRRAELRTDLRDIFLQIDAMPMRRNEVRAKREAGMDIASP